VQALRLAHRRKDPERLQPGRLSRRERGSALCGVEGGADQFDSQPGGRAFSEEHSFVRHRARLGGDGDGERRDERTEDRDLERDSTWPDGDSGGLRGDGGVSPFRRRGVFKWSRDRY